MATQSPSQRKAAAKRAAATRKRNAAAKRNASVTEKATRTAGRRADEAATRFGAVGRSAQRALLIPVGAAAVASEKVRDTARTYSRPSRVNRELDKFERRGRRVLDRRQRAFGRRRRELERDVRSTRREFESRANHLRAEAQEATGQVRSLI
jgi:hypothetical protein